MMKSLLIIFLSLLIYITGLAQEDSSTPLEILQLKQQLSTATSDTQRILVQAET